MHSIRKERRRILAGMVGLILLMLWKQAHLDCPARQNPGAEKSTCSHLGK